MQMVRYLIPLFLLSIVSVATHGESSPDSAPQPERRRRLVVGTKVSPPFSMKDADGTWSGISVDLWRDMANELGILYEFREVPLNGLIGGVANDSLDLAMAGLSITAERETICDFTHPYYHTGLGIAVRPGAETGWTDVVGNLVSWDLVRLLGSLMLTTLGFGALIWLLERRANPEQFGGGWKKGLGSGFWWSAVTLTTVGYGDKTPTTFAGRLTALVWMLSAVVIVSSFTATMTTTLTVSQLESTVTGPHDLPHSNVGTIANSTSETYLRQHDIRHRGYTTLSEAMSDLRSGKLDAVVFDAPMLSYWAHQNRGGDLHILPVTFEKQNYGIALPPGSPLREPLNRLILARTRSENWESIERKYLGDQD
jgi:polar amino acid transport system substrate-binding protein